jgi:L-cystine uptake protein TcyP (sodium:dicarboxylate symporter family)
MLIEILILPILVMLLIILYGLARKKIKLGYRILLSLILGVSYGFLLKLIPNNWMLSEIISLLHLIGAGYLALLKMLVIPLILTSIIHAILNLGSKQNSSIKKASFFTCSILLGMTSISSLIGIVIGKVFLVGSGLNMPAFTNAPEHMYTNLGDTLLAMLPSNPVAAMTQGNTIAILLFAVFLGIAARMLNGSENDKMDTFKKWVASLFAIVKNLAVLILNFTPYGILALLSLMIFDQGVVLLEGMLNFIAAMYTAMALVILMHCTILFLFGQNPWVYLKNACTPLFVAFTTRSSFGTLPVTEETLRDKFSTREITATFVPSIGATIGMNACAGIFPAMLVVMTITIMHIPLTMHLICMVMFINTIASLGISGIPGTAYIAATITLTSLNLPYAIVGLVQGIDPIIDMGRTATNVSGTMTTALIVDKIIEE